MILFETTLDGDDLDRLDAILARRANRLERTRKGRVWDVWVKGRPIHVSAHRAESELHLIAGCSSCEDYEVLGELADSIATALGGIAGECVK